MKRKSLRQAQFGTILTFVCISTALAQEPDTSRTGNDTTAVVVMMEVPDTSLTELDTLKAQEYHPQDSPVDRGFLIVASDGKSELRIRGSIRLTGINDFNGLQSQANFSTYDIPVEDANKAEPRFLMDAGQTRFGIEATRETGIGDVFMRLEGDFVGAERFRLRHAYGMTEFFLIGKTWSTFGDVQSIPLTIDLDGPNSSVAERTVQIRFRSEQSEALPWAVALESPNVGISTPDSVQLEPVYQSFPDIVGRIGWRRTWGHLQLSAIVRSITVKDISNEIQYLTGYGGLVSGSIRLGDNNQLFFQAVAGDAISSFIAALSSAGLDAVFDPQTQKFETVRSMGGFFSAYHRWTDELISYITAGITNVVNEGYQGGDEFNASQYVSANLFWDVAAGTKVGLEYSWGRRENKNGSSGTANRLAFIASYDF